MRGGEIAVAAGVEEVVYAVGVGEEGVAASPGGERDVAGGGDLGLRAERDLDIVKICAPIGSGERDCSPWAMNTLTVCRPSTGLENTKLKAMSLSRSPSVSIANR